MSTLKFVPGTKGEPMHFILTVVEGDFRASKKSR
jgi:hypothetical protein